LKRTNRRLRTRKPLPRDEQTAKECALILLWGRASIPHGFIVCEVGLPRCAGLSEVKLDPHHRRKQSQGGPWEVANLLAACRRCHDVITDTRSAYYKEGWLVKSYQDPRKVPVLRRGVRVWLADDGRFRPLTPGEIEEWEKAA
jgi:5-methylcytosine-specific restriction endonuclease McrA